MSNAAYIDVNEIKNVVTKTVFYEVKVWDNYNEGDIFVGDTEYPKTDLDALQYCIDCAFDMPDGINDVIDNLLEYRKGVTINATFYEWDEIKHLFGIN